MLTKSFSKNSFLCNKGANYFASMEAKQSLNFLNGKRVSPKHALRPIPKLNPATGTLLCDVLCSGREDVQQAVKGAQQAFCVWSKKSPRERGKVLMTAAQQIRTELEQIASIEALDTGKPYWEAKLDIAGCADVLEYFGGIAPSISGSHHPLCEGNFAIVQREPLGVVGGIGAWNYPFQVMLWKAAPALICGNTFVYKPSEYTPHSSVLLAEILTKAGIPPGAVNILQGDCETGELICGHPGISKITFTGSVETGKRIARTCANTIKKVTLELGGKSALLVFSDCDITNAVKATLLGNFFTQGEVCSNCTRVYVHRSVLDEFTARLVEASRKLKVGDPFGEDTAVGAIINENHGNKILSYINLAQNEGATVACGGERVYPKGCDGFFISPCVLTHCKDDMRVVQEEIFGPVVSVLSFECEEEAISRANASPYGLAAGVMTRDLQTAHRVASALQAGIVWINNYNVFPPEVPFGGYKFSGYGRENGMAAINDFSQLKTIYVEMNEHIACPLFVDGK